MIVFYESWRKRGEVLFEELSDELDWRVNPQQRGGYPRERPALEARVALRSFTRTSDLPLAPGRLGPAFYVLINLALLITTFVQIYAPRL
jgi:hypothetical protein